ncbi:MAG: 4-(cytidine 5'-diphospho)-2-C-methyl-D-erythritol kinase [Acidimicrobiales bacterium]
MSVTLLAPAKLTVSLRVTGTRPDGFHELDAEMVSLDLADVVTFEDGDGLEINDDTGGLAIGTGPDNLVARALVVAGRAAFVRVDKRIPAGAGLGGGSADAAAVLRWAGIDDIGVAAALGTDVCFCLRGGRARVRGIGDVVEPLAYARRAYTLLIAPFGCSSPAVYRAWDELGGPAASTNNDLELAALHVEPRLARWRDMLGDATGQTPSLAGSGSTWFVEGAHPGDGRTVVHTVDASS